MQYLLPEDDFGNALENQDYLGYTHWSLEEYFEAVQFDAFWDVVKDRLDVDPGEEETAEPNERRRRVLAKYAVAGGSARFMFMVDTNAATKKLLDAVNMVGDYKAFADHLHGDGSNQALNRLFTKAHGFVSDLALRLFTVRCDSNFFSVLNTASKFVQNPSFDGQVFELDFLFQVRSTTKSARDIQLFAFGGQPFNFSASTFLEYAQPDDLTAVIQGLDVPASFWMLPKSRQQGCYDALHIAVDAAKSARVTAVQVTVSDKHDFKLGYCIPALKMLQKAGLALGSGSLTIGVVVPADHRTDAAGYAFKAGTVFSNKNKVIEPFLRQPVPSFVLGLNRTA